MCSGGSFNFKLIPLIKIKKPYLIIIFDQRIRLYHTKHSQRQGLRNMWNFKEKQLGSVLDEYHPVAWRQELRTAAVHRAINFA